MRRNNRGGGGAQPWMQRPMVSQGGPLMTDHLGLQDIDKELELLKRKREIIEQQQQILSNEFRRNDYQQPSYGQGHSRFDDYAQLYDEMRDYDAPSRKRPIPVWEDEIPTKRFSGPVRGSAKPRGGPRGSVRGSTRPSYAPRGGSGGGPNFQTARRPPPKPERRSESKVTRPSGPGAVKAAHPVAPPPPRKNEPTYGRDDRLLEGVTPSNQMVGRMELALGNIIKEMKVTQEEVNNGAVMRTVKQTIRDRIREFMMGKIVGSAESIKAKYRELYDLPSDHNFVAQAIAAQVGDLPISKIDDPETYFKRNMYKIMQLRLKSMLEKLEEQAREENPSAKLNASAVEKKKQDAAAEAKKPLLDEKVTNTDQFKFLEKAMAAKIPFMLKKFLPYITKIMDIDARYNNLKSTITNETVKKLRTKSTQKSANALDIDSADVSMTSANTSTPNKTLNTSAASKEKINRPQLVYCKLMGKPGLPKRKQMEQFFSEFQPKSIKKHRTLHNLLFVGFSDKESLDRILAADGTVIGKYKLSIRISERSSETPKKEDLDSSTDKLIGAELDEQITDLLTSIRKAEEDGADLTENAERNGTVGNASAKNAAENETTKNADGNVSSENTDSNVTSEIRDENGTAENADGNVTSEIRDENETVVNADGNVTAEISNKSGTVENADGNEIAQNANEIITVEHDDPVITDDIADVNDVTEANVALPIQNAEETAAAENANNFDDDIIFVEEAQNKEVIEVLDTSAQNNDAVTKLLEDIANGNDEGADTVPPLASEKPVAKTPARASARLAATPSRIQTRRASKLAQND